MSAKVLNEMNGADARAALTKCCGASQWVAGMMARRPFADDAALLTGTNEVWGDMTREDILEGFMHHARIGEKKQGEQAGIADADEETLAALRNGNTEYEKRFGHIFIVFASGKTGPEMLELLQQRLANEPDDEILVAAVELAQITQVRLKNLL